jgi:hypothetical protein
MAIWDKDMEAANNGTQVIGHAACGSEAGAAWVPGRLATGQYGMQQVNMACNRSTADVRS